MKVITIYPENIGASGEWSDNWIKFICALGWDSNTPAWKCAYIVNVEMIYPL